jgi:hypothetical protein
MDTTAPSTISPGANTATGNAANANAANGSGAIPHHELARHHVPRLVLSSHVSGRGLLTTIAQAVNVFVGSMWTFVAATTLIVVWLFAGNVVGFDKTPWPLLLTLLNLPQLSIMISLQVSANLAQRTSDARAVADHETLGALHVMAKHQLEILEGQNQILDLLKQQAESPRTQ